MPEIYLAIGHLQSDLHRDQAALQNLRKVLELDPRKNYARFGIWLIRARLGEREEATRELRAQIATGAEEPGHEWESCIGHFLVGDLPETNFLAQAIKTARRPTDQDGQLCEARYYMGMKRLFDGDKPGAIELLEKCVASHQDNREEYTSAMVELRELRKE
jgi:lipoprotein NlpI